MAFITLNLTRDYVDDGSIIVYKPTSMSMDLLISWSQDIIQILEATPKGEVCRVLYDLSHPGISMQFLVLTNREVYKPGFTAVGFSKVQQILENHPQFTIKLAVVLSSKGTGELASKYVKDLSHGSIIHKLFFDRDRAVTWLKAPLASLTDSTNPTKQFEVEASAPAVQEDGDTAPQPFFDRKEIAVFVDESLEYLPLDEKLSAILGRSSLHLETYGTKANTVSRKHALLQIEEGYLYITDLDSTNGTYLNGERLEPMKPYMLRRNDQLTLGEMNMQVIFRGQL